MDFNLKHWRDESAAEEEEQETAAKLPRLLLNSHPHHHSSTSTALPLFVQPEPTSNLSAHSSDNSTPISAAKLPRMMGSSSCFSMGQWQELELQALIYRHIMAGAAVPSQLLHLLNKSLVTPPSPYYLCNPLHQYYPQYQPALLQSGYWGRAAMDPEPGRCRRTDGKKWRCSRDVVAGQKYCERHMHRGRNRSRKPVEIPTSAAATSGGGEASLKALQSTTQGMASTVAGGTPPFSLSGPSSSMDLLNPNRRLSSSVIQFEGQTEGQTATLRHFFDDWPRSGENAGGSDASATKLSMSMASDFSLKLGTGNEEEARAQQLASAERDRRQLNWGTPWEATNRAAPMGGPLAEALRSSMSTSSPTSVLHRLPRSSVSETSYISS